MPTDPASGRESYPEVKGQRLTDSDIDMLVAAIGMVGGNLTSIVQLCMEVRILRAQRDRTRRKLEAAEQWAHTVRMLGHLSGCDCSGCVWLREWWEAADAD